MLSSNIEHICTHLEAHRHRFRYFILWNINRFCVLHNHIHRPLHINIVVCTATTTTTMTASSISVLACITSNLVFFNFLCLILTLASAFIHRAIAMRYQLNSLPLMKFYKIKVFPSPYWAPNEVQSLSNWLLNNLFVNWLCMEMATTATAKP